MVNVINTLWTGGWDSTFRVLYATIIEKKTLKPHYIIDVHRKSSLRELQAISEVRALLERTHPEAAPRLLELELKLITEIKDNEEITSAYRRLTRKAPLGGQYDWLARYAYHAAIQNLELSVHIDDKAYYFLREKVCKNANQVWVLKSEVIGDENIFKFFSFPMLELSKTDMRIAAQENGFIHILERSWFCHQPKNGKPCGVCNPCIYSMQEGMRYRFPLSSVINYYTRGVQKTMRAPKAIYRRLIGSK